MTLDAKDAKTVIQLSDLSPSELTAALLTEAEKRCGDCAGARKMVAGIEDSEDHFAWQIGIMLKLRDAGYSVVKTDDVIMIFPHGVGA